MSLRNDLCQVTVLAKGNRQSKLLNPLPKRLVEVEVTATDSGFRELSFQGSLQPNFKVAGNDLRAPAVVGNTPYGHFNSLEGLPVVSNSALFHEDVYKWQYKTVEASQDCEHLIVRLRTTSKGAIHINGSALSKL